MYGDWKRKKGRQEGGWRFVDGSSSKEGTALQEGAEMGQMSTNRKSKEYLVLNGSQR